MRTNPKKRGKAKTSDTPRKGGGWRRLLGFLTAMLIGGLAGGFIAFASYVDRLDPSDELPKADGIVVWTGAGGRLPMSGALLEAGLGERLLVSGVNPSLTLETVATLVGVSDDTAGCCLDVDYAALDTRGNARETAAWAEALGYEHVILVTSAYHMPRARVEIGHEMGRLRITPVPVRNETSDKWWNNGPRFQRLSGEYGKFLLAMARGRANDEQTREPILPEPELASPQPEDAPG